MTRIAVTGARGRLGGQVCSLLAEHDGVEVLALTRAVADYDDRPALEKALARVDVLALVSSDGEAELVLQHHLNVAAAVAANGVARVVVLSGVDADAAERLTGCPGRRSSGRCGRTAALRAR
jgi:NAD(P)H dehydrogenase (quinone)